MRGLFVLLAVFTVAAQATPAGRLGFKSENNQRPLPPPDARRLRSIPFYLDGPPAMLKFHYDEYAVEMQPPARAVKSFNPAGTEVRTLMDQGPKENRINLTILGDGYTQAEKEKFFADAARTVKGLFDGKAFASYLPLFNVYAVFVPSNESGLGDGVSKDTVFKLYRSPRGSKRAILPGDEQALDEALALAPATDYPIVLANDDFYGGLGGRYAISTRSERSSMMVLRHELGHNFGEVGEEYDNGYVYFGANSAETPKGTWNQWITGTPQTFEGRILTGDYVWQNLSGAPYTTKFNGAAAGTTNYLWLSVTGWETQNDVQVRLNGEVLQVPVKNHPDRQFMDVGPLNLAKSNTLDIEEKTKDGDNVLGFAVVYSYPPGYDFTPDRVASFATYDNTGAKHYRPTHNGCIMRDVEADHFCVVDKENFWHQFLGRVSLVDSLSVVTVVGAPMVELRTLPLSGLKITWLQKTSTGLQEVPDLAGQTEWPVNSRRGTYVARVQFQTPEVRVYNETFTVERDISL
jgi:hypothetical protein